MILGSIGALYQRKIKRFMVYSGITNVGYMLIGLASGITESAFGLLIYLIIYVVMTIAFFCFVLGTQTLKSSKLNTYIADLTNLGKVNAMAAFSISIIMFSFLGLPPLAGFFGKMYLFLAALQAEYFTLAIIGVPANIASVFANPQPSLEVSKI